MVDAALVTMMTLATLGTLGILGGIGAPVPPVVVPFVTLLAFPQQLGAGRLEGG